jgi:hypothetical protein
MHNTFVLMQVQHRVRNLSDDMSTEVLAEICQTHNLVKQFTAWAELEYDVVILT